MVIGSIYLLLMISQLGKHFWPDWSFVSGIKIDYLSPTLYLTDLVWLVLVAKHKVQSSRTNQIARSKFQFIKICFPLVLINVLLAERWQVAVYGWFRLYQIWWWAKYFSKNKKEVIKILGWIIPWWIGIEAFLGLGQVINGGSLGGVFYWLGERRFDYLCLGVARISWFGRQYVRAYGTFSHPNSLAGFLLAGLVLKNGVNGVLNQKGKDSGRQYYALYKTIVQWTVNWMAIGGIVLTGSRVVWVVGIMVLVVKIFNNLRNKQRIGFIFTGAGVFMMMVALLMANLDIVGGWSVDSVNLRWKLFRSALEIWRDNWLFGVGMGNFLVRLPFYMKDYWWLQPVHNIFMLILVETGILGLVLTVVLLFKGIDFKKYALVWLVIILTGLFDHYWLMLPQNMGLLAVVLGLSVKLKDV